MSSKWKKGNLVTEPKGLVEEEGVDAALRPTRLSEFVGQAKLKEKLRVFVEAARQRQESLDHVLFCGPPGLGKTTLAHILAHEMGAGIRVTSGPALEKAGDLAAILTSLSAGDVLFIDEIHRLRTVVEETLYPAMEDFKIDLVIGEGASATTVRLDLPRFTLVGATTRMGLISSPMRGRFGIPEYLEFYKMEELQEIVQRAARLLHVSLDKEAARELGARSRGTPRIANRLLRRVRDYAQVKGNGSIHLALTHLALESLEVDNRGFDAMDRRILLTIIDHYGGGPVGLETLAATLGEESDTLEEVYEPYLIQEGYIHRTPKGRVATGFAYEHFQRQPSQVTQQKLSI